MKIDRYGQQIYSEDDLCELYLKDPSKQIKKIIVDKPITISDIVDTSLLPKFIVYTNLELNRKEYDLKCQNSWYMPDEYKNYDIAKYVLDLCQTDEELQRVGKELLLYQERDMFPLLKYLKYLVDTMRLNNIVWGVGRGSSVASFVLFLLGVHRINSLYFDLAIEEFIK